jgi:imidazolonepropionase-like amidohydrolase
MESNQKGAYGWNMAIRSGINAHLLFAHNRESADDLKKQGFGVALTSSRDGIVRGSGALVMLNAARKENESILADKAAAFYSFNKGSSTQDYPTSLTGAIALLRQTYYDAQWYRDNAERREYNISLDEFNKLQSLPQVFEANEKFNVLRASALGSEFNVKYLVKGGGDEYQRVSEIQNARVDLIIPLEFPEAFDVEDPFDAENVSLGELKHWELAPYNAAILEKNAINFAFTMSDLKDKSAFFKNLRKAVACGLSQKTALRALTTNPAAFIKASDKIGSLKKGFYACFFISNKSIFEEEATVLEHWTPGERNVYADIDLADIRGNYLFQSPQRSYTVTFTGELQKPKAILKIDTSKKNLNYSFSENNITFSFMPDSSSLVRCSAVFDEQKRNFYGRGQLNDGTWFNFQMNFVSGSDSAKKPAATKAASVTPGKVIYPFTAFGRVPNTDDASGIRALGSAGGSILFRNVNLWTNEHDSVLREHDVLIVNGKISQVGKDLAAPGGSNTMIIEAKGKHLTPGIIDEHSHIALSGGVNESAEASSAEVRMSDVINPDDIQIYRQLSGGVTTSQLLHGSANPIGGQSAIIKLRWGQGAEAMKFEGALPFIKFALGENVKQSNWGDLNVVRFPQSRMGVEQVYNDFFTRAKEYNANAKIAVNAGARERPGRYRRDLELEALAEILSGKRFITCHSYVQSEINMLLHLADSFGFKVNTFTHILEGYKVADKMKAHGSFASTFSDWWAYKNEVMEAIPYNAAIMSAVGVITAINSDDAEMARRLNQEAAKGVKYGGMSETEALKMVTLNPAKMLHIDDKVGSVKVGKSADLVLWSDHPLSVYAKVEKTIIDGHIYFDRVEDQKLRDYVKSERARLIGKLLIEKQKGTPTVRPQPKKDKLYHCNTIEGVSEEITGHR